MRARARRSTEGPSGDPRAPGPAVDDRWMGAGRALIRLQQSAGNRALGSLLAPATSGYAVQRMKSGAEEEAFLTYRLRDDMGITIEKQHEAVRQHFGLPEEAEVTPADTWRYACAVYEQHVANGTRYRDSLRNALMERNSAEAVAAEKLRDEGYDRQFRTDYQVRQVDFASYAKARSDSGPDYPYHNNVEPDGSGGHLINAMHNYAKDDANGTNRLPNSEILWQQFKSIAGESADLSLIIRNEIANVATLVTIYLAYSNGEVPTTDLKAWKPDTEEFLAVLGTENAKSAAFLLKDHAHRIGKTIYDIQTSKLKIILRFVPAPDERTPAARRQ
ncbi:hypothetical protein ILP97_23450 [Amycolatopsis sp. H6(2020)]|nr:hypothetical protein [Amycolatopsis sp. H6(2020)]